MQVTRDPTSHAARCAPRAGRDGRRPRRHRRGPEPECPAALVPETAEEAHGCAAIERAVRAEGGKRAMRTALSELQGAMEVTGLEAANLRHKQERLEALLASGSPRRASAAASASGGLV